MGKLTKAQFEALKLAPYYGFQDGSNMWPMVAIYRDAEKSEESTSGEDIDSMLRLGLLKAVRLKESVITDRDPAHELGDCECTHEIVLTEAGKRALEDDHGT